MDAAQLVARAERPAVATDAGGRILACNAGFLELAGCRGRSPAGERLDTVLPVRERDGSAQRPGRGWASLLASGPQAGLQLEVLGNGGPPVRVSVSPVVVVGGGRGYSVVYLLEPERHRRRADEVIDRLLAATDSESPDGLPAWWTERHSPQRELTPRQLEILRRLAGGETPRAIGAALGMSLHTVRTHVQALHDRLGVHSRAQVVAWALRHRVL